MPIYLYKNIETGEVVEVVQTMTEKHEYSGINGDEKGLWRRVFVNPSLSTDTKVDPFDQKSFVKSTVGKNDTFGDLQNRAKEASELRAQRRGFDPVKEAHYKKYSEERGGKIHPEKQKENFKKSIEKASKRGLNVEL
jgi:hypothetical protein